MVRCSCVITAVALMIGVTPVAWGQQYYLYSPKPVPSEEKSAATDGVLVRDIPIKKGDTLFGLSKKISGRGSYYPQILLFNDIKNPDKILAGDTLKVPVPTNAAVNHTATQKAGSTSKQTKGRKKKSFALIPAQKITSSAAPSTTELSLNDLKQLDGVPEKKHDAKRSARVANKKHSKAEKQALPRKAVSVISPPERTYNPPAVQQSPRIPVEPELNSASGQKTFERAVKAYRQDDFRTALDLFDKFLVENPSSPLAADANLYKAECYLKQSGL